MEVMGLMRFWVLVALAARLVDCSVMRHCPYKSRIAQPCENHRL